MKPEIVLLGGKQLTGEVFFKEYPKTAEWVECLLGRVALKKVPEELLCLNAEILGPRGWYQ